MGVMEMLSWLKERFVGPTVPRVPMMLRVRDPRGDVVPQVDLHCVFEPNGRESKLRKITASGLCILHWPKGSSRLRLFIQAPQGAAEVQVAMDRPDPDRVIEVQLAHVS